MKHLADKKAVFVGCARDCAPALGGVLANVAGMASLFAESACIFVENDSKDDTRRDLELWCRNRANAHVISPGGPALSSPLRTIRLAAARNAYLARLRAQFAAFDYLFVLDCDEVNATPLDMGAVGFLQDTQGCSGVFANADGIYYDIWALRHPTLCPGDAWEEVGDCALTRQVSDEDAFRQTFAKRIFKIAPDSPPLEVLSAFGGLGIYKIPSVLRNARDYVGFKTKRVASGRPPMMVSVKEMGWQCCEHVSFHAGLQELGERLFVMPDLINCRTVDWGFAPSYWRTMLFDLAIIQNNSSPISAIRR